MDEMLKTILKKLKPQLNLDRHGHKDCGSGWVRESYFTFSHCGKYYWIAILCAPETFAFKQITPEWVNLYSNLLLSSPEVYIEWDRCHQITDWTVKQSKVCDLDHCHKSPDAQVEPKK